MNLSYYAPVLRNSSRFFATSLKTCLSDPVLQSLGELDVKEGRPVFLVAEIGSMRPEDPVQGKYPTKDNGLQSLWSDAKMSDVIREYGALEWAGSPEKIQEENSFFGALGVWRLR